jgi:glycosyltransferase involved in cell wall biosynthesis
LPPPATGVVRLATDFDVSVKPRVTARLERHKLEPRGFALMVSTLEPRKNHWLAYQLWQRLAQRRQERTIPLILVGEPGWQKNDRLAAMMHDRRMWGTHVRWLQGASDEELAWLYSNAAFTLYPSEFEGWGLPITESLAFGTHCLAADNTSLKEASQGLAWHADILDGSAWLGEIERCIADAAYLSSKRADIRARFVKRRWKDFAADLFDEIKLVQERDE